MSTQIRKTNLRVPFRAGSFASLIKHLAKDTTLFRENRSKLKLVPVDGGEGPVSPSEKTINDGTYKPLSRPIFIYVNKTGSKRAEVQEFVRFYIKSAPILTKEVGYIPLPAKEYKNVQDRFEKWLKNPLLSEKVSSGAKIKKVLLER